MKPLTVALSASAILLTASDWKKALIVVLAMSAIMMACTEVTQTTGPVIVDPEKSPEAAKPAATVGPSTPASGTISFDPDSITVAVGGTVHVKVVVTDAGGAEVESVSITASVADTSVLRYTGTDARTVSFLGVKTGTTSVIISASSLQASLTATVTAN